ncbi:type III secretion system outer membrane ring subunit SctC [Brenneria goodwinii]|uniref:Type 3 secretion system secretin n=1 Tax=Brenneria goodwinii TaxID=1109412 RepID=A0A0G4K0X5_9GAMM|nr:type III secretion system outer membrane ring subunit SctC [Brenneria goodwinii]MCG8155234.1 type III secretion system outer membrane ring subunit SctC [Brenneria goodwinii]MCG8159478.1 type III secretion system outer membrane ring subunit SctC [Brenneria goodwinii]MCG8164353.1 type III secretion system outer membrane ring subunit SctC [Brenneria goodwinii]MCG8169081.1 type III secretion system outer membrane ring subunit SctC [Brenneria goodwinii]MCG8173337.1 type III secretion system oute
MRNVLYAFLLTLYRGFCWSTVLLGMLPMAHAVTPPEWNKGAYAYSAEQTLLSTILTDFANSHGVELVMDNLKDTLVEAKIRAETPAAFLDRLALEHRFQWFVYNHTLYISSQDTQASIRLEISPDAAPDLKQALSGIGLLDPRFGWGELPEEGVVLVTGPQTYIDLIRNFSQQREKQDERRKVMIFPLRFASVSDRTLQYRDQRIVIPGVATILSELMDGQRPPPTGASGPTAAVPDSAMEAMRENTRAMLTRLATRNNPARSTDENGRLVLNGRISADVRNNALLVRDDEKRREEYQQLVEQIDVPQNLVNIDAIILDVDRTALSRLEANWQGTLGNVSAGSTMMMGRSTLFVSDFKRFFADIQALEGEGTASIVANPSVLTLENQPAIVDFSRTAFITATGERVAQIQPITAGTSLQVTPRVVGQDGPRSIQLVIDIEDGRVETGRDGEATGVKRGTVSTQALIGENRALVLGGFHVEESGDRDHRIPLLGDIPWLGRLFTSTRHEVSRRERLFILTPHLIGDQTDPTRYVSAENRHQINDVMNRVSQRNGKHDLYSLVENALRDLAGKQLPAGFQSETRGTRLSEVCRSQPGLVYDSNRYQWYGNGSIRLTVGVVRNSGTRIQRFDESVCGSNRTLAVAAWPKTTLAPGESTEVFLALQTLSSTAPPRRSLLASY